MKKVIATALLATVLGGCQSIFGHQSAQLEVRPLGAEQSTAAAAIALEAGRQQLNNGDVASAIASFRTASLDPATAAPAHNGLGISYALLGRGDIAERHFLQAIAAAPDEERYSANLAKFYRSREAAMAKVQVAPAPQRDLSSRMVQAGPSQVMVSSPSPLAGFTRVSRQEVAIRTEPSKPVNATSDPRRRNPRFAAKTAGYPVHVDFVPPAAPEASTRAPQGYPVKIVFAGQVRR